MFFSKDAPKARRFKIWGLCLLIVVVSASIVFVFRLVSRPSEPFVTAHCVLTTIIFEMKPTPAISIELSNRMSFDVHYWVMLQTSNQVTNRVTDMLGGGYGFSCEWVNILRPYGRDSLVSHIPPERVRLYIVYMRRLKPFEISVFNKIPWLRSHYPFRHCYSFPIYEWKETDK